MVYVITTKQCPPTVWT